MRVLLCKLAIPLLLFCSLSTIAEGQGRGINGLWDHVTAIYDQEGRLTELRTKQEGNFDLKNYLVFLKSTLLYAQLHPESVKGLFDRQIANSTSEEFSEMPWLSEQAIEELKKLNIEKIFGDPKFIRMMGEYEREIQTALLTSDVLAKPGEPGFFFRHQVGEKILKKFIEMAWSMIDTIPGAALSEWIFNRVISYVEARQDYYRGMILHYLDSYTNKVVGISTLDAGRIKSSIFEANIKWWDHFESERAKDGWDNYGQIKFRTYNERNNERVRKYGKKFDPGISRINYSFVQVSDQSGDYIYNSGVQKGWIDQNLSLAYDFQVPKRLFEFRLSFELIQIGLRFVPAPGPLKKLIGKYMTRQYGPQVQSEGALLGFFYASGRDKEAKIVAMQSLNPFVVMDFLNKPLEFDGNLSF